MYRVIFVVLSIFVISCSQSQNRDLIIVQKNRKYSVDSLINKERNLILMAKIEGQENIGPIPKDQTLQVETIYNIFKDNKGRIIYISEMPKSPNDDWFIAYKSYFDENGNLFAFQRLNNFFNSKCTKYSASENLVKYYDEKFAVLDSTYTLTDSQAKDLSKLDCKFPYNFPYKTYKTVSEYQQNVKGL